jgi:hypothetical protein
MKWVLFTLTVILIVLHQDWWNWDKIDPRLLGFMPIGIWYHAVFCVAAAILLAMFVAFAWPSHLESAERDPSSSEPDRRPGH